MRHNRQTERREPIPRGAVPCLSTSADQSTTAVLAGSRCLLFRALLKQYRARLGAVMGPFMGYHSHTKPTSTSAVLRGPLGPPEA